MNSFSWVLKFLRSKCFTDRQAERQTGGQTDIPTDGQRETYTNISTQLLIMIKKYIGYGVCHAFNCLLQTFAVAKELFLFKKDSSTLWVA